MTRIAINEDYGGFGLSDEAIEAIAKRKGVKYVDTFDLSRDDADMIAVIEELGDSACSRYSSIKIVDIPDDVDWIIQDYDGIEWVAEKHRTWG
jgi:ABC-type transporter Mla MlaB component